LNFRADKATLIEQYRFATEQALARAEFLNASNLYLVQAFTLYLTIIQREDTTKFVWSLTGLLIRLALSIGLHRDGSCSADMSPFEVEMRRRLWWNICFLDVRSAEEQVSEPSISEDMFDTKSPTNVNDEDIYPGMSENPVPQEGLTDMTVFYVRQQIWRLIRRIQIQSSHRLVGKSSNLTVEEMLEMLHKTGETITSTYLRYLKPTEPLCSFIESTSQMVLAKTELTICFPRATRPPFRFEMNRLFDISITLLETSYALEHDEAYKKWCWLFRGHVQWRAVAVILSQLCNRPWNSVLERAWKAVTQCLGSLLDTAQGGTVWRPIRMLLAKVERRREDEIRHLGGSADYVPSPLGPFQHPGMMDLDDAAGESPKTPAPTTSATDPSEPITGMAETQNVNASAPNTSLWDTGSAPGTSLLNRGHPVHQPVVSHHQSSSTTMTTTLSSLTLPRNEAFAAEWTSNEASKGPQRCSATPLQSPVAVAQSSIFPDADTGDLDMSTAVVWQDIDNMLRGIGIETESSFFLDMFRTQEQTHRR